MDRYRFVGMLAFQCFRCAVTGAPIDIDTAVVDHAGRSDGHVRGLVTAEANHHVNNNTTTTAHQVLQYLQRTIREPSARDLTTPVLTLRRAARSPRD